jgi:hypothetical protein
VSGLARVIEARCQIPDVLRPLFEPARYKIAYGGRGSGKSWTVARLLVARAAPPSPEHWLRTAEVAR